MIFTTALTVPAGTAASSPVEAELDVAMGIIHQVDITFLDGPENEVHVALRSAGIHQIAPTNTGSFIGNARTVSATLYYPLEEPPYRVVLQGWSPDADYEHEITADVHVLPREILQPPREELGLLRRLTRALLGGG